MKNLSSISINAAREIAKFREGENTGLKYVKKLSKIIKQEVPKRISYGTAFSEAYSQIYGKQTEFEERLVSGKAQNQIYLKLNSLENVVDKEVEKLEKFCGQLSYYTLFL